MNAHVVSALIFGLLGGFGLGWFLCETRVWRMIKKMDATGRSRL